ncbi:MAG: hypothetical protein IKQ10_10720 [Oscillospiraceae bacterium]|nr:hypothetical protein [Oscillospiraceae bacterium]
MFSIGEKIMYGGTGVCVVEEITSVKLSAMEKPRDYYVLKPLYQSGTIQIPVDNIKVPIRPVMTRFEAESLVDCIPDITATICYEKNLTALRNHYQQQLNTYDCRDLVRIAKSIYAKKKDAENRQKKIGMTDEKFLRRAEDLLFGELAVALEISRDDVRGYISDRLQTAAAE